MPDVLLINPAWGDRRPRRWPPLDLLGLAALLRGQGATVELADARAVPTAPAALKALAARADTVFITSSPLDRWQRPHLDTRGFAQTCRGLDHPRVVLLGVHGTLSPAEMLAATGAWTLVRGESEQAAPLARGADRSELPGAAWLQKGELRLGPEPAPVELAALPMPAFELAPPEFYEHEALGRRFALLETSRGCAHACRFCLKAMYGPGVRRKSVARVLAEAEAVARLGARCFYFMDLEFTGERERALELCAGLAGLGLGLSWGCQSRPDAVDPELLTALAGAGCRLVRYGVESGSPAVLEGLGKPLDPEAAREAVAATERAGMDSVCSFMLGLPGEGEAERAAILELARSLPAGWVSFQVAVPYPGTGLAADCPDSPAWSACDAQPSAHDELEAWRKRACRSFYLQPGRLARLLGKGRGSLRQNGARLLRELSR
ncbi:B12-binding domain-containing radical SAM protein [Desulfoferula mesophila]|uniref:Radical SAM core domain-containing protein n=1 Tax=Desulfoferula mesophila TaxID=3058419 RepID=A0AAU9F4E5_9BACT|nr:hypothetical protein FAK_41080 [Desulfoferula mesophilus]